MVLGSGAAVADEPRIALVIASGQVAVREIASVPACPPSARSLGRRLTALGFMVVESIDQTRGETGAAIAKFARRLRGTVGARAVIYACGPVAELEGRAFILPSSAVVERPTDVLTQGVLLRSLLDMLVQARPGAALFALDAFADPPHLPPLPAPPAEAALGLVVSAQAGREGQRTALASALLEALAGSPGAGADLGVLLTGLQARLGQAPDPPQQRVERPAAAAALVPAPEAATAPAPAEAAAPPVSVPLSDAIPLSEAERRAIQATLAMLGYYADRIDGSFGPGTRAAIRRYQREIGEAATGALTADQARRLIAGAAASRRR